MAPLSCIRARIRSSRARTSSRARCRWVACSSPSCTVSASFDFIQRVHSPGLLSVASRGYAWRRGTNATLTSGRVTDHRTATRRQTRTRNTSPARVEERRLIDASPGRNPGVGLVGAGLGLLFPRLAGKKTRKEAEKTEQRLKAA